MKVGAHSLYPVLRGISAAGFSLLQSTSLVTHDFTVKYLKCGSKICACSNSAHGRGLYRCSVSKRVNVDISGAGSISVGDGVSAYEAFP